MASRRLDISSLLCDDNAPSFSPLDALVQAATEERKRLGNVDDPLPVPSTSALDAHPILRSPAVSPHLSRHPVDEAERIHLQQQLYHQRPRSHHDEIALQERPTSSHRPQPQHHRTSSRDVDYLAYEADRRRRIQEAEHQQRIQEQQRLQDIEFQRQQEHERALRGIELDRRRREEERLRAIEYERQQREHDRREHERVEAQRQQEYRRLVDEQRREAERQRELERQREEIQHLERARGETREIERHREAERRRQFMPQENQYNPVSISHLISHPPHRNPDPTQISLPISPDPPTLHDDHRPVKKRRYSESPTRPVSDDLEILARERERMVVGELGYGRVDSPTVGPSLGPRRPGSGHNQARKAVAVADLLSDKEPSPAIHRIISPVGRRSPPGSHIGRAKAARKSDEYMASLLPPPLPEPTKVKEEPKLKPEPKLHRPRQVSDETRRTPAVEEPRPKKALKEFPPQKVQPVHSKTPQDDAHEWFLHQYDEDPSPTTSSRPDPPRSPSPSASPIISTLPAHPPKSPPSSHRALTPITAAAVALERELEDLVSTTTLTSVPSTSASSAIVKKQEESDDMELAVDLAVTELVETLESDTVKDVGMEVDVEDELLSLVDDRPPPPSSNSGRRPSTTSTSASHASATPALPAPIASAKLQAHPPHRSVSEASHSSPPLPSASTVVPAASSSSTSATKNTSARSISERGSMPPPASTSTKGAPAKKAERAGSVVPTEPSPTAPPKKKKEPAAKASSTKAKAAAAATGAPAKPKAKSTAKSKKAAADAAASATASMTPPATSKPTTKTAAGKKAAAASASRSRSTSVMPVGTPAGADSDVAKADKQEEEEEDGDEDDKLYCVCKTKYDENRFMIACDRCDEWYHTQCVNMPDQEVDLVDQFICPSCVDKNPHLNLRTTYKQRCLFGLRHPDPDSPKACHKAARGAFSKYCSDVCGVKFMQSRIDTWAKKGGKPEKLWESVKHAEKREGVVVCAVEQMDVDVMCEAEGDIKVVKSKIVPTSKTKVDRETERLNGLLVSIVKMREEIQRGMEIIVYRERLLQLASERAEKVGQCGWDQRLCCDDEELADIGAGALETYEDAEGAKENGEGDMEVDGSNDQWWCPGNKVCERHAGWQTIRYKDVCKEKEMKEAALNKLTTREREIRKRIEDLLDPHSVKSNKDTPSAVPLKSSATKLVNGHPNKTKSSTTATGEKKGKKRKAPS